jgi:hypothetical protein
MFDTFSGRCQWLHGKIERKTRGPKWAEEEIRELKGSLRGHVFSKQIERKRNERRAGWFASHEYAKNIESLLYEPTLDPRSPKYRSGYHDFFRTTIEFINRSISVRETEQREAKELERLGKKPEVGGDAGSQQTASRQEAGKGAS